MYGVELARVQRGEPLLLLLLGHETGPLLLRVLAAARVNASTLAASCPARHEAAAARVFSKCSSVMTLAEPVEVPIAARTQGTGQLV
jgi:hypothetical protein